LIVTGTEISSSTLYNALKSGAQDYVLKNDLDRLIPVVTKEMRTLKRHRNHFNKAAKNQVFTQALDKGNNEIFLMDPMSLKMVYANDTLLKNIGYSEDEVKNLPAKNLIADYDVQTVFETVSPLYRGEEKSVAFQFDRKRKDGSTYPVKIHLEITQREHRQLLLGTSFDISRQIKDASIIQEQQNRTKKLELDNKYKSEFYANLSHEMRTILSSNLLLTKMLKDNRAGNLETDQLEYLDAVYQSGNTMLELLNEVLDLSKIESGNVAVKVEEFSAHDIQKRTEQLYKPIASEKKISFQCTVDEKISDVIKTDRLRLDQVLNNLITNAFKFTKEGHVHLTIFEPDKELKHLQNGTSDKLIAFEVSDTGIGIPKSRQSQIFKSYVQADDSITEKQFGGTGLGLTISKEIAEILGGTITLESEPEAGSTFTLIIPQNGTEALAKQAKKGKVKITQPSVSDEEEKKPIKKTTKKLDATVLLVDDSSIHNMALKEFLGFRINQCITAESAEEAYSTIESHAVDCIVLDMYLPDADGKEVIQRLKENEDYKDIPVIIYSGKSLTAVEESQLNEYAHAIVQKNVKSYSLLLENILNIVG